MPDGVELVRVRRDGLDVKPIQLAAGLSIPFAGGVQGSKSSTIVVDYVALRGMVANGNRLRPELPQVTFPCLSFVWEIVTSPDCAPPTTGRG